MGIFYSFSRELSPTYQIHLIYHHATRAKHCVYVVLKHVIMEYNTTLDYTAL